MVILMKNESFFFKKFIFNRCFRKYRPNMPFCDYIECCFYFLARVCSANSTIRIMFSVIAAFLTDLFIQKNKDPKCCPIRTLYRHYVSTRVFYHSRLSGTHRTQRTSTLKIRGHSRHLAS